MSLKPTRCPPWPLRLPADLRGLETNPYAYRKHHCILHGGRHTVQVLVLDPPVQRLYGVLGELRYTPQPIQDRPDVLQHEFALGVHAFSLPRVGYPSSVPPPHGCDPPYVPGKTKGHFPAPMENPHAATCIQTSQNVPAC